MALTTCPDCNREISSAAPACPNCGRPTPLPAVPKKRFGIGTSLIILLVVFWAIGTAVDKVSGSSSTSGDHESAASTGAAIPSTDSASTIVNDSSRKAARQRITMFNKFAGKAAPNLYRGVEQSGDRITIRVSDQWNYISRDEREAWLKQAMTMYLLTRKGGRNPKELDDLTFEVKHEDSGRLLAEWGALRGYHEEDP
jgi:hypothetical protein